MDIVLKVEAKGVIDYEVSSIMQRIKLIDRKIKSVHIDKVEEEKDNKGG